MSRFFVIVIRMFFAIVLVGSVGSAGYFFYRYQQVQNNSSEAQVRGLKGAVAEIMELPDEEPTVATVTDPTKLSGQPFFQKAQMGDNVLIFTKSKKAILYRPSIKKIIDVTTIQSVPSSSPAAFVAPSPSPEQPQ